ncbi:MAG: hypothetical protein H0T46_27575 [Deltaproteobacteria bacterium]|nr:hypothetical protein [Deltaproteobacteria bacterium]
MLLAGCPGSRPAPTPGCPHDIRVVISEQKEIKRYAACTSLGSLTVRSGATIDLSELRALETITGDLDIGPTVGFEELKLSELVAVEGTVRIVSNTSLRGMFLPRLERAGRIEIESNASLTTIVFPRLQTVAGSLLVNQNSLLEIVDFSELTRVGKDLVMSDNGSLALIEGGKLESVQEVRLERNRKLPPDAVDGLRAKTPPP